MELQVQIRNCPLVASTRRRTRDEDPVEQLVPVAVIGHVVEVAAGQRATIGASIAATCR